MSLKGSQERKLPFRMCVACRKMRHKNELIRIIESDGKLLVDVTGKLPGRGMYLCRNSECIGRAIKLKAFKKALGDFTVSDETIQELQSFCVPDMTNKNDKNNEQ